MQVGDSVRLVRVYGDHQIVLPGIVLATEEHKRLRVVEPTSNPEREQVGWELVPDDDDDHQGVLDLTNAPAPAAGTVHVVYFALTGGQPARTELNVPTREDRDHGLWVEAV